MPKLNRLFKKIQKFDVIENDSVIHLFKITHLDNSTAIYDNYGNRLDRDKYWSGIIKTQFNKPIKSKNIKVNINRLQKLGIIKNEKS